MKCSTGLLKLDIYFRILSAKILILKIMKSFPNIIIEYYDFYRWIYIL